MSQGIRGSLAHRPQGPREGQAGFPFSAARPPGPRHLVVTQSVRAERPEQNTLRRRRSVPPADRT